MTRCYATDSPSYEQPPVNMDTAAVSYVGQALMAEVGKP